MSGPARDLADRDDPAGDPGVLLPGPVIEGGGFRLALRSGGTAVLAWRAQARAADAARTPFVTTWDALPANRADQILVRVGKGRAATQRDLAGAWMALRPGGRFVVTGHNDVGIASWIKRLAAELGQPGEMLALRARQRVVAFAKHGGAVPTAWPSDPAAALFAGGGVDDGSARLIEQLTAHGAAAESQPPEEIIDLGCGAGVLALAALALWPRARALLLDADARAIAVATARCTAAGLGDRARLHWWDQVDPLPPGPPADLVLCNPPAHAGTSNDISPALAMLRAVLTRLAPHGRLLLVANIQLPYERPLALLGTTTTLWQDRRFKVLCLTRA